MFVSKCNCGDTCNIGLDLTSSEMRLEPVAAHAGGKGANFGYFTLLLQALAALGIPPLV